MNITFVIICSIFAIELNKLVTKLNRRIPRSKRSKEVRQSDVLSSIRPPLDAPTWAISSKAREPDRERYITLEVFLAHLPSINNAVG